MQLGWNHGNIKDLSSLNRYSVSVQGFFICRSYEEKTYNLSVKNPDSRPELFVIFYEIENRTDIL